MKSVLRGIGIFMLVLSVVFLGISFDNVAVRIKKPADLYADDYSVEEMSSGDYLHVEVYALLDCYAVDDWYTDDGNTKTYTDHNFFYPLPVFDVNDPENTYYVSIKAHEEQKSKFESIADDTYDFLMGAESDFGENVFTGDYRVMAMEDELYKYMKEYFMELGDDEETIEKYVLPYNLIPVNKDNDIGVVIGLVLLSLGAFLVITMSILIKKEEKKVKNQTEVIINGVTYPKSRFDDMFVDALLQNEKAIAELCSITGVTREEAKKILKHWGKYYYY